MEEKDNNKVIKAYKGFNKDMTCRGFKYEVGKEYEADDAVLCEKGFHACENPLDVFDFYGDIDGKYCIVEQSGKTESDGKKNCFITNKNKRRGWVYRDVQTRNRMA